MATCCSINVKSYTCRSRIYVLCSRGRLLFIKSTFLNDCHQCYFEEYNFKGKTVNYFLTLVDLIQGYFIVFFSFGINLVYFFGQLSNFTFCYYSLALNR